jgi:hypothetical protein
MNFAVFEIAERMIPAVKTGAEGIDHRLVAFPVCGLIRSHVRATRLLFS